MMKVLLRYIILLFFLSNNLFAQVTFRDDNRIPDKPNPPKLVNDFAKLFPDYNTVQLENKLVTYNDSTSTQIVVVTIESLNGFGEDDYSLRLSRKWGIGQANKNNGILILIAKEERAVNIELGYGIEGYISDADAKRLIENVMIPQFRNGNYFAGVDLAINDMIAMLQGTYQAIPQDTGIDDTGKWVIITLIIIFLLIIFFASKAPPSDGSGGSYTGGSRGWNTGPIFGGGWSGGSGSGWSGGSSGGFGGFGGGSFGGGGASGRW